MGEELSVMGDHALSASLQQVSDLNMALDEPSIFALTNPQGKIACVTGKFCDRRSGES